MASLRLLKPITVDGQAVAEIEIDPTLGGLKAFEAAITKGEPEMDAFCALLGDASGLPAEAVDQIRSSDLARVKEALDMGQSPLPSSAAGAAGESE